MPTKEPIIPPGMEPKEPEPKEMKISKEEYESRLGRLKSMGRIVGDDFDMGVDVGKKPGWRYIFEPHNKIEVDPNDLAEKGLDYCFGIICHEGSHRKISRLDFIPKKIWQEMGFSFLMNAVEDPRVNNWVMEKYDGAKDWLERAYYEDIPIDDQLDEKAKKKLGYTPKHVKYGLEVIKYWHLGEFTKDLDEDIREALDETIKYAELAYETLPDTDNPTEKDIKERAQLMYGIVYNKIWPIYQELVDKAFDEEALRQMIENMLENGEMQMPEEGQDAEGMPIPWDQIPDDLKEKLKQKLKELLDQMDEDERKKFEEDAEGKAEDALDGLEDELNEELKGKMVKMKKSAKEEKEEEEKAEEEKEKEKEKKEDLKKKQREYERKLESQKTEYEKALTEVAPYVDKVAEDLINIFMTERFPKFKAKFPGQKLRLKGAMDWKSRKEYRKLFETREPFERKKFSVMLLVDLSGSMRGEKIEETFKGAVLFAEALNRVAETMGGLKVAIYGFQDTLIKYKKFDTEIDDELRNEISVMQREPANMGNHNQAGYNSDGYSVYHASKMLEDEGGDNQFLIILSDGFPVPDYGHRAPGYQQLSGDEELKEVVRDIVKNKNQYILGVGLGPGTEHVADFYDEDLRGVENIPNVNVTKLSEVIGDKTVKLIQSK